MNGPGGRHAVHSGHEQVDDDGVECPGLDRIDARLSVRDRDHVEAANLEHDRRRLAHRIVVVDDQDARHCGAPDRGVGRCVSRFPIHGRASSRRAIEPEAVTSAAGWSGRSHRPAPRPRQRRGHRLQEIIRPERLLQAYHVRQLRDVRQLVEGGSPGCAQKHCPTWRLPESSDCACARP